MDVSLPQDVQDYIAAKVRTGEYADEGALLSEAVRLMKQQDAARNEALEAALEEGLRSGPAQPFDREAFLARMRARRCS